MHRSSLWKIVFCVALVALVISSSTLFTRALTPTYLPGVLAGQFAQYNVLKDSCKSSTPPICQSLATNLNDTTYAAVKVVGVSGPTVTLELISIFKNGTGSHEAAIVNVATGTSNVTVFSQGVNDYFLLAGGLRAPDRIWNTSSARTLTSTSNEMVLGEIRAVNFLNFSVSGSQYGTTYSGPAGFAFDQSSGLLIDFNIKLTTTGTSTTMLDIAIRMVDNNVWHNAYLPDFDLSADPTSVSATTNISGNSTITLHRLYGFTGTVSLSTTTSASGLSCSVSPGGLPMGGSDTSTLSCRGSPGTYTVTVEGNGGYSVHSTPITVTLSAAPIPAQPASILSNPLFDGGIGIAAVVVAIATLVFLRRKPRSAVVVSGDASVPGVQA